MRKLLVPLAAALAAAALTTAFAAAGGFDGRDGGDDQGPSYAIGLWGDLPYSAVQETVGIPNLLADMNSQDLAFTAHDGDLKAGSGSPCDDALYARALGWFDSLRAPAVFTPGDNDWTDSDRPSN